MSEINLPDLEKDINRSINFKDKPNYNSYYSLIVKKLHNFNSNISGCFYSHHKLQSYVPIDFRNIIEIRCNGLLSSSFCTIPSDFKEELHPGDFIILREDDCLDIAQVKSVGELVRLKRNCLGLFDESLPEVIRKCTNEDFEKVRRNIQDEERAVPFFKKLIEKHKLEMKLVSVHFQFDRKKLFFFYTADGRVDFRELAKDLAAEFKTRIELRQIGVRDEAKKIGGVGTCGREFCCSSFLCSFKKITTQLATEQNLLSNMGKLSGPCGKLKCCLSFEINE
ncbi:PSP1 domain-containing protein [Rosettibacter firmus]|uniref:PSP1 domain-containing protein n=1 Tax=Rosettibacter firmus TaxID=3111522 RepID=UPI00336C198F